MDCKKARNPFDFLQCLGTDVSVDILCRSGDPADLARASCVSRYWRHFVIANGLAKSLFLRIFPQFSNIVDIFITTDEPIDLVKIGDRDLKLKLLEKEHMVYARLLQILPKSNFPHDNFVQSYVVWSNLVTLNPTDPDVWRHTRQTSLYKFNPGSWMITDIMFQLLQVKPVGQEKSISFQVGYHKNPGRLAKELQHLPLQYFDDRDFAWAYTSPVIMPENGFDLCMFKLPEPLLCVEGYLKVELSFKIERDRVDAMKYLSVNSSVLGHRLSPAFELERLESNDNKLLLKYYPEKFDSLLECQSRDKGNQHLQGCLKKLQSRFQSASMVN